MFKIKKTYYSVLVCSAVFFSATTLKAQDTVIDIPPTVTTSENSAMPESGETHPTLNVTPDKSELIRLEEPAGSIIIGNPTHINIVADSSTTLVVVPRSPGATHFTILGKTGKLLMQRHVIVASPKQDYVRIKRTCQDEECQSTSVFYCPDMCHEIGLGGQEDESGQSGASAANNNTDSASDLGASDGSSEGSE